MYVKTRLGIFIYLNDTRISNSKENLNVQKCTRTMMYKISKVRYSLWYLNRTEAILINSTHYDWYTVDLLIHTNLLPICIYKYSKKKRNSFNSIKFKQLKLKI